MYSELLGQCPNPEVYRNWNKNRGKDAHSNCTQMSLAHHSPNSEHCYLSAKQLDSTIMKIIL